MRIYKLSPPSQTMHSLTLASVLTHSDNRRICGFAFGYTQISPYGETSHIPRPLFAMLQEDKYVQKV